MNLKWLGSYEKSKKNMLPKIAHIDLNKTIHNG